MGVHSWVRVDQDSLRSRHPSASPDLKSPRMGLGERWLLLVEGCWEGPDVSSLVNSGVSSLANQSRCVISGQTGLAGDLRLQAIVVCEYFFPASHTASEVLFATA